MRGMRLSWTLALLPLVVLQGCDRGIGRDAVAGAGDFRLHVEEAAQMVAPVFELPNDPGVMEAVSDFWMDYVLLAWAVNQDGELERVDLSALIDRQVSQELVVRLRDAVIQVDTTITDEELREIFDEQRPVDEVRARHVLLRFPDGASQAQQDSVRALAEEIRDRARAGADFGELAQTHSDDPGSAPVGGDLGFFGRGMMVPPFEEAAFALEPGEVSDVVPSDFGLHVIRVEERRTPAFEEIADEYREHLQWEWMVEAESIFLEQLERPANIRVQEGAAELVRTVAADPEALRNRDAGRALTVFEGGSYTAGDLRDFLRGQPLELRGQIEMAQDEQLEAFLLDLTRDRLLVAEARRRGIEVGPEEIAQFESEMREQYAAIASYLGLSPIQPRNGENLREAVDREVKELMARLVRGEQELVPLEGLSLPLRAHYRVEVSEAGIERAITRVEELRSEDLPTPAPAPAPAPAPDPAPAPTRRPTTRGPEAVREAREPSRGPGTRPLGRGYQTRVVLPCSRDFLVRDAAAPRLGCARGAGA